MQRNYLKFFRQQLVDTSVIQKNWIVQSGILMLQVPDLSRLLCDRHLGSQLYHLFNQGRWLNLNRLSTLTNSFNSGGFSLSTS